MFVYLLSDWVPMLFVETIFIHVFPIRATSIEMVTTLAHSQHGRQYLAQQGIMDKISNMIRGADMDPFSSLYLPGEYVFKTTFTIQYQQLK